jgi:hypothetical protein
MKKCTNCGAEVADGALWCPQCGADVGNEQPQPTPVAHAEPVVVQSQGSSQEQQPRQRPRRRPLFIPKQEENTLGLVSFILTMVALFGLLTTSWIGIGFIFLVAFPITMLLGFIAMFKKPRGFAVAAFIISLLANLGTLIVLLFFGALFGAIFSSM